MGKFNIKRKSATNEKQDILEAQKKKREDEKVTQTKGSSSSNSGKTVPKVYKAQDTKQTTQNKGKYYKSTTQIDSKKTITNRQKINQKNYGNTEGVSNYNAEKKRREANIERAKLGVQQKNGTNRNATSNSKSFNTIEGTIEQTFGAAMKAAGKQENEWSLLQKQVQHQVNTGKISQDKADAYLENWKKTNKAKYEKYKDYESTKGYKLSQKVYDAGEKAYNEGTKKVEEAAKGTKGLKKAYLGALASGTGMAMDMLTGPAWFASMATRTFGGNLGNTKDKGGDDIQDYTFATLDALKEVGTEMMFAGAGLAKTMRRGAGLSIGDRVANRVTSNMTGRAANIADAAIKTSIGTAEELTEELTAWVLDPIIANKSYANDLQKSNEQAMRGDLRYAISQLNQTEAQSVNAYLNSDQFIEDMAKKCIEDGAPEAEAYSTAEYLKKYFQATLSGDDKTASQLEDELVQKMAGNVRETWNLQELKDTLDATAVLTLATGIPGGVSAARSGARIKSELGSDFIKGMADAAVNFEDETDSIKAQVMQERIASGKELTDTQAYELAQATEKQYQTSAKRANDAYDLAANNIDEENLVAPVTSNANGEMVLGEATLNSYNEAENKARNSLTIINEATENPMAEEKVTEGAKAIAGFKTGVFSVDNAHALAWTNTEARSAFTEETGIDLNQYIVKNKDGSVNISLTNANTEQALFALAANNLVETARLETANWVDKVRGEVDADVMSTMGSNGQAMWREVGAELDATNKAGYMLNNRVASIAYAAARNSDVSLEDFQDNYGNIFTAAEDGVLERAFEAGKQDRLAAMTTANSQMAIIGEAIGNIDQESIKKGELIIETSMPIRSGVEDVFGAVANTFGINIHIVDNLAAGEEQANGIYNDGDIWLNINEAADKNLSYVFMHEVTHHIKLYAPEEYNKLETLIRDKWYKVSPTEMQNRIKSRIQLYKKVGQDLTEAQAMEEIICDAMGEAINDEKFVNVVCEDIGLGKAIVRSIKSVLRRLRNVFAAQKYQKSYHDNLLSTLGILEDAEALWMNALHVAIKNQAAIGVIDGYDYERLSLGYHAGDLGKSTVDDYWNQGYGRGTGHFGFGTYFVGDEMQISHDNYAKRPHIAVDFDKYNLFKPSNFENALALHDGLRILDGYAQDYSALKNVDIETRTDFRYYLEKAIKDYEWNIPQDLTDIAEEDRWLYESDTEEYEQGKQYILDAIKEMGSYDAETIIANGEAVYDELHMTEDEAREMFTTKERSWRAWVEQDNPGVKFQESEDETINRRLESWRKEKEKAKLLDKDDFIVKEAIDKIPSFIDRREDDWARVDRAETLLRRGLGYSNFTSEEIDDAIRETEKIVSNYDAYERGNDSAATVFMKQLGYEGVDVRDISEMDNTGYGSVIYDLKGEDLARKNEIGTAKFSISPQQDAAYMDAVNSGDMETAQRMVDEAANINLANSKIRSGGRLIEGYHTTQNEFNVFSKERIGTANGYNFGKGFYFALNKSIADEYAYESTKTISAFLNATNPFHYYADHSKEDIRNLLENGGIKYNEDAFEEMDMDEIGYDYDLIDDIFSQVMDKEYENFSTVIENNGYDGIWAGDELVVFNSNQVKLSDPVTYDNNDNVIPLSQRFNAQSNDIRYSLTPEEIKEKDLGSDVKFSIKTFNEVLPKAKYANGEFRSVKMLAAGRDLTKKTMKENGFSDEEIDEAIGFIDEMSAYFRDELGTTFTNVGWENLIDGSLNIIWDTNSDGTYKRDKNGNRIAKTIAASAMVKNGEYPVNFDFTTICNKREAMMDVINQLTKDTDSATGTRVVDSIKLDDEAMWKINEALKTEGLDTACLGCFVEARRYNTQKFIEAIDDKWNARVRKARKKLGLDPNVYFDFAQGKEITSDDYMAVDSLWGAYEKSKDKKRSPSQRIDILMKKIEANNEVDSPYLKQIRPSDILTAEGIAGMKSLSTKDHDLPKTIKSIYGTSAPKEILAFTPYNSEIALLPNKKGNEEMIEYLKSIGGVRMQSFSDFKIENVLDYMQMVADLAARKFPAHAYTKVIHFARIFGKTGIKINMSVMFDTWPAEKWKDILNCSDLEAEQFAREFAGLQWVKEKPTDLPSKEFNGGYLTYLLGDKDTAEKVRKEAYERFISQGMSEEEARVEANKAKPFEQSINYREAAELENLDGYRENCGIIAVAYGNEHMRMLLADPNVRYIIPYHKSGLPTYISKKTNLVWARDYTLLQNTDMALGGRWTIGNDTVVLKNRYKKYVKEHSDEEYPAIAFMRDVVRPGEATYEPKAKTSKQKVALAGTGAFDVYESLHIANTSGKGVQFVANEYIEDCINNNRVPVFWEYAGDPNYYKTLFDFMVTDGEKIYEQHEVTNNYGSKEDVKANTFNAAKEQDEINAEKVKRMPAVMGRLYSENESESLIAGTNINPIRYNEPDIGNPKHSIDEGAMTNQRAKKSRLSVTPEMDNAYNKAVEDNNEAEIKSLVEQAAYMNGYTIHAYHGSNRDDFNEFSLNVMPRHGRYFGQGFYFTDNEDVAKSFMTIVGYSRDLDTGEITEYHGRTINSYLKMLNPVEIDYVEYAKENKIKYQDDMNRSIRKLVTDDVDGLIVHNIKDNTDIPSTVYVVFDPSQIKSAEPVVYSDNGNVIPLSKRFNDKRNDIRYSIKTEDEVDAYYMDHQDEYEDIELYIPSADQLIEESRMRRLRTAEMVQEAAKYKRSQTKLTNNSVMSKPADVRRKVMDIVMAVMRGTQNTRKYKMEVVNETVSAVEAMYKLVQAENDLDAGTLAFDTALKMIEDLVFVDMESYNEMKTLKAHMKNTKIYVPDRVKKDIDYPGYFKRNRNRLWLSSTDGNDIDTLWEELQEQFGEERFPYIENASQQDYFEKLDEKMDEIAPLTFTYGSEENIKYAEDIADQLLDIVYKNEPWQSFADKKKNEYEERTKKIRARYEAEIDRLKTKNKQLGEQNKVKMKELKADQARYNREKEAERRDRELRSKLNKRIGKDLKRLDQMLRNPTKEHHAPHGYAQAIAELLYVIDPQTQGSYDLEINRKLARDPNAVSKKRFNWLKLRSEYEALANDAELAEGIIVDESLISTMKELADSLDGKPLRELTTSEFEKVVKVVKTITHGLEMQNKSVTDGLKEGTQELANEQQLANAETREIKGRLTRFIRTSNLLSSLVWDMFKPREVFQMFGGGFEKAYMGLRRGLDQEERDLQIIQEQFGTIFKKYNNTRRRYGRNSERPGSEIEKWRMRKNAQVVELESGETVSITPSVAMTLYLTQRREAAEGHLTGNLGICFEEGKGGILANITGQQYLSQSRIVTANDIKNIVDTLTDEQKKMAEDLQQMLIEYPTMWANEVSLALYNYEKFKDPDYFPMLVKSEYLSKKEPRSRSDNEVIASITNPGFSKDLVPNASNPIVIGDVFDIVARHINSVILYHAYARPITDMMRLINSYYTDEFGMRGESVQQDLENTFGKNALSYVRTLLADINGQTKMKSNPGWGTLYNRLLGSYKRQAIGLNISVALQQPTAIARAWNLINARYFVSLDATHAISNYNEMVEHCPIAAWKADNRSQTDIAHDIDDIMMNNTWSVRDIISMGLYGQLDNMTWSWIWVAVKNEIQNTHKDVQYGTDEFWALCNDRASEIFDLTQVVDSPFHRSQVMRNQDTAIKTLTSFMAEPTTSVNMMLSSYLKAEKVGGREGTGIAARATSVFLINAALVSAAKAVADMFRNKQPDDDEEYTGFWLWHANLVNNFIDNIKPWNYVPVFRDWDSYKEGWGTSNMGLEGVALIAKSLNDLYNGDGDFKDIAKAVGMLTGIPLGTIIRDGSTLLEKLGLEVNAADGTDEEILSVKSDDSTIGDFLKNIGLGKDEETQMQKAIDKVAKEAEKKAKGLTGDDKNDAIWDYVSDGYTKKLEDADIDSIKNMREAYIKAGGDADVFDDKVIKSAKTAYKKTIGDNSKIEKQRLLKQYLIESGLREEEISSIAYQSDTCRDLKAAMRYGDEAAITTELVSLIRAGLTYEDYVKAYENRNRGADTYNGKYKSLSPSTGEYTWPTQGTITSEFGEERSYEIHEAIDIGAEQGSAVLAADGGQVISAGWNGGYGYQVVIRHENGDETYYSHLNNYNVQVGDVLQKGQQLGTVGSTGKSTGPHLDFKLKVSGSYVDPIKYLS